MLRSRELTIVDPGRSWFEISLWEMGKGRKKEKGAKKSEQRKARDGIQTAELDRRDQVTATNSWPNFPTESSTPNLHRATIAQPRVRMEGWRQRRLGSMGTIWKKKKQRRRKKKRKTTNRLDTHRPSHGRSWPCRRIVRTLCFRGMVSVAIKALSYP